jgi:hypothetical protein
VSLRSLVAWGLSGFPVALSGSALSRLALRERDCDAAMCAALARLPALRELRLSAWSAAHGGLDGAGGCGVVHAGVTRLEIGLAPPQRMHRLPSLQAAFPSVVAATLSCAPPPWSPPRVYRYSDSTGEEDGEEDAAGRARMDPLPPPGAVRWRGARRLLLADLPPVASAQALPLLALLGGLDGQLRELSLRFDLDERIELAPLLLEAPSLERLHVRARGESATDLRALPPHPGLRHLHLACFLARASMADVGRAFPGLRRFGMASLSAAWLDELVETEESEEGGEEGSEESEESEESSEGEEGEWSSEEGEEDEQERMNRAAFSPFPRCRHDAEVLAAIRRKQRRAA